MFLVKRMVQKSSSCTLVVEGYSILDANILFSTSAGCNSCTCLLFPMPNLPKYRPSSCCGPGWVGLRMPRPPKPELAQKSPGRLPENAFLWVSFFLRAQLRSQNLVSLKMPFFGLSLGFLWVFLANQPSSLCQRPSFKTSLLPAEWWASFIFVFRFSEAFREVRGTKKNQKARKRNAWSLLLAL